MRIRNKKTGEIIRFYDGIPLNGEDYDSLAELTDEWEDYTQKEPLPLEGGMSEKQNDEPLSWEFQNNLGYVSEVGIYAEDKAIEIVDMVGVSSLLKDQIDGDDAVDKVGNYLVRLTTKNRKSIRIDVCKPEVDHSNERANCYTIG